MARKLKNWLETYMEFVARDEPPTLFKKWCGISVIAAALRRKCYFDWQVPIFPNHYIMLIGPSGSKKGTAMGVATWLARHLSLPIAADAGSYQGLLQSFEKSEHEMVEMGEDYPNGNIFTELFVLNEEFTVFLQYENKELLAVLCRLYDCPHPFNYKIVSREENYLRGVWLNILGATTPRSLKSALPEGEAGEGFTSRFILVYGDVKSCWNAKPRKTKAEKQLLPLLVDGLLEIQELKGGFTPTDKWVGLYETWYLQQEYSRPFTEPHLEGYLSRRASHFMKLCMVVSAATGESMEFTEDVFYLSLALLEEVEKEMPKVFGGYGRLSHIEYLPKIARFTWEQTKGKGGFTMMELVGEFMRDVSKEELQQVVGGWMSKGQIEKAEVDGKSMYRNVEPGKVKKGS